MKLPIFVLAFFPILGGSVASSSDFRQTFREGVPDPKVLDMVGLDGGCRVDQGPEGLAVRIPPGGSNGGPVGLTLRPWLRGDFEIIASYDLVKAGPPSNGYGAGIGLVVESNSADEQSLTIERIALPKEGEQFTSTHIFADTWGEKQYRPERSGASSKSGKLRLARVGAMVEASYADGGGEFRPLRKVELGTDDISLVRLACYTGSSDCEVVATVAELSVKANEFTAPPTGRSRGELRSGAWKSRLGIAAAINLCLIAALVAWRWPGLIARIRTGAGRSGPSGPRAAMILSLAAVTAISWVMHARAIMTNYVHEDERIWTTCAYYYRLVLKGDFGNPLWSGFDGIDAPHVAHVMIGAGLHASGQPVPDVPAGDGSWAGLPLPSGAKLRAARMPSTLLGVAIAPMLLLVATLATGRWVAGLVAGLLYAVNPLALLCQARAMSDGPLMFFGITAILVLCWSCRREVGGPRGSLLGPSGLTLMVMGPAALGLATGSKLTGVFASATSLLTLAAVVAWGLAIRGAGRRAWAFDGLIYLTLFGVLTTSWTILANPTLYPDPVGRFRQMLDHRWKTGQGQRNSNPEWGVYTTGDRLRAFYDRVVADGTGPAATPLLILSCVGLTSMAAGEVCRARSGRPPSPALAILIWGTLLFGVMMPSLPLNWERYYLPFLPIYAIGVGAGVGALIDGGKALSGFFAATKVTPTGGGTS